MMNGNTGNKEEFPPSKILAEFAAPTSVLVRVTPVGEVSPGQLIFLGHYLLEIGTDALKKQMAQQPREEESTIAKPASGIVVPGRSNVPLQT